jgi:hypothetical protein
LSFRVTDHFTNPDEPPPPPSYSGLARTYSITVTVMLKVCEQIFSLAEGVVYSSCMYFTRNFHRGKGRPEHKADNPTAICETIV